MSCYYPIQAFRGSELSKTGKRKIVFNRAEAIGVEKDFELSLPCGRCIGCRLEYSRQWAMRCVAEAKLHGDQNCFITLTYRPEDLPKDGSLDVRHFQLFMKRFRKYFACQGLSVRFYHCGEYGETTKRPHYHAVIFGVGLTDFPDLKLHKVTKNGNYYKSDLLADIWGKGHCLITAFSFETAAYVARYCTKKKHGEQADEFYNVVDSETGEILHTLKKEYATMSRRPGIGKDWLINNLSDVYPSDQFILRRGDRPQQPPRFFDSHLELTDPSMLDTIKIKRKLKAKAKPCLGLKRLSEMGSAKLKQVNKYLKRGYDHE